MTWLFLNSARWADGVAVHVRVRHRILTGSMSSAILLALALAPTANATPAGGGQRIYYDGSGATVVSPVTPSASLGDIKPSVATPPVQSPSPSIQVQSLSNAPEFRSAWAGSVLSPSGVLTTYVTRSSVASFQAAIESEIGSSADYPVVPVARSWQDLSDLTQQIATDQSLLAQEGIQIVQWGPDAASNTVEIQVANYSTTVASELGARYGSAVSVVRAADPTLAITPATRDDDTAPWFAGDPLFLNGNQSSLCTLAFMYTGNNSGNEFNMTAGHCGEGTFNTNYNNNYLLGSTSTDYWAPVNSTNDVQSITSPGGFEPDVWFTNTNTHNILGAGNFGDGQQVTMDGMPSGEKPGWTIIDSDQCISGVHFSDFYSRCHIWEATNSSAQSCYQGDSGGPVYQRTNGNGVYAAGIIIGGVKPNYHTCFYMGIYPILSLVNGSIATG